ncbi:MAG: tetratricopeptide repeat protein [Cyclobacteriaceae bacterium]|nr:tetratricopeptide repeat protein [Cyclobacteriaceae bacterium]
MNNERISILESFLKAEPEDPFNWYAIAMEYKHIDLAKSKEYLTHLLTRFPDYLPTYYQMAELLIEDGTKNDAEEVLEKGITLAKVQKNTNTQRELQNLLNNLLFDED